MNQSKSLYLLVILFFVLIANESFCSSLIGIITNSDTNEPIPFVNVFIKSEKIGCLSDVEGEFLFDNIDPGRYKITIEKIGYITQYDSLEFAEKDSVIDKDYKLQTKIVNYTVNLTKEDINYHNNLINNSKDRAIIEIVIDSLTFDKRFAYFYSTFSNNTSYPVYVLKENECIKPFTFEIRDSDGNILKQNTYSLSCDTRYFYNPNLDDLIEIPPHSKINYPKTEYWLYDFSQYPLGMYEVQISYEYANPLKLKSFRSKNENYEEILKDEITVAKKSLRGSYTSQNLIKFENK